MNHWRDGHFTSISVGGVQEIRKKVHIYIYIYIYIFRLSQSRIFILYNSNNSNNNNMVDFLLHTFLKC